MKTPCNTGKAALPASGFPGRGQVWHMGGLSAAERRRRHGAASCEPEGALVAGERVRVIFGFELGETEMGAGGRLRIAWRWPFDWTALGREDMEVSAPAVVVADFVPRGDLDPWNHHIDLRVEEGRLRRGDRVDLVCGARNGWGAPTFAAPSAGFLLLINPEGGDDWIRLPDPPSFALAPGPPVRLVAASPSGGVVGEKLGVMVRAEDKWGNPTPLAEVPRAHPEEGMSWNAEGMDPPGVYRFALRWRAPGVYRPRFEAAGAGLQAVGNPVRVHPASPAMKLFWGDLHSGQTDIGCGAGSLEDHFAYARKVAGLQFASQQANDHYVGAEVWDQVRRVSRNLDAAGEFACFLGCEWSPPTEDGGDRNVIYRGDEKRLRRSGRFFREEEPDPEPDLPRAPEFLAAMRDEEVILNLHVGGRPTNLDFHEPAIEPLFEIHSTHGTSEWFVEDALRRGYKVGVTAGSDGVMGRPGACQPGRRLSRTVRNGLTAVYAGELTREGLWEAFKARRCYGTSGERILLRVEVDGREMGEEYETDGHPLVQIQVEGTAAVERVDLLRGVEALCTWRSGRVQPGSLRVLWGGAEKRGTARDQLVVWDGGLHLESGRIRDVRGIGLQSGADRVRQDGPGCVRWNAATGGNDMGLVCKVEGAGAGRFESRHCTFDFGLEQVLRAPGVVGAGGESKFVEVGPAPAEDGPQRIELEYRDSSPLAGEWPYWVRVVQVDRARAWSSPVYVRRPPS